MFKKEMTFADAIKKNKDATKVFKKYGLQCTSCMGMVEESLETGAINHGIDPDEFLNELNKLGDKK
jgi:hybrid cluster-associated redox disulfide protein